MKKCRIRKITIQPGCIGCKACAFYAPDIFVVKEKSELKKNLTIEQLCAHEQEIEKAARRCPVDVIKISHETESGDED